MNLYHEHLMHHYRHPVNRGTVEHPDFASDEHNPSCGDSVSITGKINNDIITQLMFTGTGCVISQAAASLLVEYAVGKTVEHLLSLDSTVMRSLVGIELGPTRLKCALLPLQALQQALEKFNIYSIR